MLELWLNQGYFTVKNGGRSYDVWLQDIELPIARYNWNLDKYLAALPDIDEAYNMGIEAGYSEEKLIARLLELYLPVRYFKVGDYEKVDLVIGLCGHRGAGKSVGAAMVCLFDFMLRGLDCWSNMPVSCKVCYRDLSREYHSIDISQAQLLDLEGGYRGGVVLADECNLSMASSYKTMSSANQDFGALVQQVRKRKLSVIWTAQSFMSIDKNLRWQTDLVCACRDVHLAGETDIMGDVSAWGVYDIGSITGKYSMEYEFSHPYITQYPIGSGVNVWMRPFWGLIDTALMQSNDYVSEYRENKRRKVDVNGGMPEIHNNGIVEVIQRMKAEGCTRFWAEDLWNAQDIVGDSLAMQAWGRALEREGYIRRRNGRYFYELVENS